MESLIEQEGLLRASQKDLYNIRTDLSEMRTGLAESREDLLGQEISLLGQETALSEDFIDAQEAYGGLSGLDEKHWMDDFWANILGHPAIEGAY